MSDYLKGLGADVTATGVFEDLYGRVISTIGQLDKLRRGEKSVPGTALEFDWCSVKGDGDETYSTTDLLAHLWMERANLVSVTRHMTESGDQSRPSGIRGYRGNELSGDYYIKDDENFDCIVWKLGKFGLFRSGKVIDEPVGESASYRHQKVSDLGDLDVERLAVVTQGILDNLTVVELLAEGENPEKALSAMGRTFSRT